MKVSIIIPAYNEEKSLSQTLTAACAIDYPDFEIIVVNNASTDTTETIARQFPVKVLTETNKGLLFARERGRIEASGEIIANMDADCLPSPDWLTHAIPYFDNPNVVGISGPYDYYDGSKSFRFLSLLLQKYGYTLMNIFLQCTKSGGVIIGGNNLIRAKTLESVGGYDTRILFYGEDTNTAKRISQKGKILFLPKLTMETSARRFQSEGIMKIGSIYFASFFKELFFHKK